MTPLQVASLMATYASGVYRDVTLVGSDQEKPTWTLPGSRNDWQAIRLGMYGVVNDPDGTAYHHAHFVNDRYALAGKTGSATAYPWPTSYAVPFVDDTGQDRVERVPAGSKRDAIERFVRLHPAATFDPKGVKVASKWPTTPPSSGDHHSHAWFGGFLQPIDGDGQPDWSAEPRIAFAALVEFGGSGGRTSGPLAKRIAAAVIDRYGDDLHIEPMIHVPPPP